MEKEQSKELFTMPKLGLKDMFWATFMTVENK